MSNRAVQCDQPGGYYLTADKRGKVPKFRDACCHEIFITKMLPLAAKLVRKGWRVELEYRA